MRHALIGLLKPKNNVGSSFTHPYVNPNWQDLLFVNTFLHKSKAPKMTKSIKTIVHMTHLFCSKFFETIH